MPTSVSAIAASSSERSKKTSFRSISPSRSWTVQTPSQSITMRPEARFSDGTPVTAQDVVFSHNLLVEQGLPSYAGIAGSL